MRAERWQFQPMLIGEVARVAGDPRETIRTRAKKGVYGFERPKGWKRFSDFESILISIHARLKRATGDDDLAQIGMGLAAKALMDEWEKDETGIHYFALSTFMSERFLLFWRHGNGEWEADIFDTIPDTYAATDARFNESYNTAPVFTVVNMGTLMRQTLHEILKVQIEAQEKIRGDRG